MSSKATTNGRSGRKRHVFVLHDASSLRPRYDLFPEAHVTVLADPANHDTYTSPPEGTLLSLVYPRAHLDDVAALAREVHDERPIDRIFGLSEECQYTLAYLRDELGIPGPGRTTIAQYRNKILMKRTLQAAGVAVPRFAAVRTDEPDTSVLDTVGYPTIVKPVDQTSGSDIYRAQAQEDVLEILERYAEIGYEWADVEELVSAPMFHADFLLVDGRFAVFALGRYSDDTIWETMGNSHSIQVPPTDAEFRAAKTFALKALLALPLRTVCGHLELFSTERGWVFCETSARLGGGRIQECLAESWGVDLPTLMALAYGGGPTPVRRPRWREGSAYAFLYSATRGTVTALDEDAIDAPFPVVKPVFHTWLGASVERGTPLLSVLLAGESYAAIRDWLEEWRGDDAAWRVSVSIDACKDHGMDDWLRLGGGRAPADPLAVSLGQP